MNKTKLRWGILGAADIARKNWKAIWNSGNGQITALASRDVERSKRFIAECQTQAPFDPQPKALRDYEELLGSRDVDAVYIPLPTGSRKPWVLKAAAAGKHVVCEKPCAVSVADLKEMIEACQRHRVQFMDGVMFMYSRRLERIRQVLDDAQSVGRIRRITSAFTFNQPEEHFVSNIRARSELEPAGCLGDVGWYCIRFALWAMNWRLPRQVSGRLLSEFKHKESKVSVPTEFSGELFFDDGVSSSFYSSFITEIEQWAIISGDRGHLRVPDFVLPSAGSELVFETGNPTFETQGCDFKMESNNRRWVIEEHSHSHPNAQETNLFRNFAAQVLSGALNPLWPEMALKTQQVMEACRDSSSAGGKMIDLGGRK